MQAMWHKPEIVQAVFCDSKSGTGKTSLAVLAGAYEVGNEEYDKIIYIRNAIPLRDQGYLPGELESKEFPYMQPFVQAMDNVKPGLFEEWSRLDENKVKKIEVTTTTYTRGINFKRAFVICDEVQNWDLDEIQTIYTRCSDDCKIVSIGSIRQIDNKKVKRIAGLTPFEIYMEHFKDFRATFHKLETNYRGEFSSWSDEIETTINKLKNN
jgi:predicted ribonuclease YlaK